MAYKCEKTLSAERQTGEIIMILAIGAFVGFKSDLVDADGYQVEMLKLSGSEIAK